MDLIRGKNLFLAIAPGQGKTTVMHKMIRIATGRLRYEGSAEYLRAHLYRSEYVAITLDVVSRWNCRHENFYSTRSLYTASITKDYSIFNVTSTPIVEEKEKTIRASQRGKPSYMAAVPTQQRPRIGYQSLIKADTLEILVIVALSLTTREPDDAVAAAFDRRERPSIVLAKNAPPTLEDEHAAQRFITDPENDDAVEFFAILLLRYRANMNRRLLNLHKYIAEPALLEDFRSALSLYKTMSITKECPNSTDLRSDQYPNGEPSFRTMLGDIIDKLQALSAFQLGEDEGVHVEAALVHVCQYVNGVTHLMSKAKRQFPGGQIPYRWVDDPFVGTGEGQINLCGDYSHALQRGFQSGDPLAPETQRTVNACIHAELRIILRFSALSSSSPSAFGPYRPLAAARSKQIWNDLVDERIQWQTRRNMGAAGLSVGSCPYARWEERR
ncbi:hypothetical protein BKA93DRAFT_746253 [Sparassis latifolia]